MATLTPTLTLTSTDVTTDQLAFSVTDNLSVTAPHIGLAKIAVSTTGANNIIQPSTDGQTRYVFIRHAGGSGTINVELTGDVKVGKLSVGEWMFMPVGGHSLGVQLQSSTGTINAEYAYWTKG